MSLLSICQSACATAPVGVPTSIVGNTDETSTLLLALANDAAEDIARRPQGGWVSMIREYDFTTAAVAPQSGTIANVGGFGVISGLSGISAVQSGNWYAFGTGVPNNAIVTAVTSSTVTFNQPATQTGGGTFQFGQSDYQLPADFERPIDNTFWDRSRFWAMRGPQSPQQWQLYKSSVIGRASIQRRYRFRSIVSNGARGTFLSIDPTPLDNGSAMVFEYVSNAYCQSSSGVPQSSWQADTDIGMVDEYLIRLSLKWRLLRRLGMAYSEELDEFERQIDKAMAFDGGAPVLDMTPSSVLHLIGPFNAPESGYGPTSAPGFGFGSGSFGGTGF